MVPLLCLLLFFIGLELCLKAPGLLLRLILRLVFIPTPFVLIIVFDSYDATLRKIPNLTFLPSVLGWGALISAPLTVAALFSIMPGQVRGEMVRRIQERPRRHWSMFALFYYTPRRRVRGPDGRTYWE